MTMRPNNTQDSLDKVLEELYASGFSHGDLGFKDDGSTIEKAKLAIQLAIQLYADKARLEERQHTVKLTTDICTGVVTPDFAMAVSNERLAQLSYKQGGTDNE